MSRDSRVMWKADLPHPAGRRPITGDLHRIDPDKPFASITAAGRGLGPVFQVKAMGQQFAIVGSAEVCARMSDEDLFGKELSPAISALRFFAGDGLFTAHTHEPNWGLAHAVLMPGFTKNAMRGYHDTMLDVARELTDHWDAAAEAGTRVDVASDLTKVTLETIGRAAFDTSFDSFSRPDHHPFVAAMIAGLRAGQRKAILPTYGIGRVLGRRVESDVDHHQRLIDDLVAEMIARRRREGDTSTDDLLGLMLNTGHPDTGEHLGDTNIRHQILTFLVAGHETTSGALSLALALLTRRPDLVARAQAEVDDVLGPDPSVDPTFAQVPRLRYVRRVLDEALRLWPTAPGFARSPRRTTNVAGHVMRPRDTAIVALPLVHRDPEVWGPDADAFDPDHFEPARVRARPGHTYKPFGTGERACIGRQFALHEAVIVLARLLHRYDLTPDPAYELDVSERLTLMPRGFTLGVQRRTPSAGTSTTHDAPTEPADSSADTDSDTASDTASPPTGCPVAH